MRSKLVTIIITLSISLVACISKPTLDLLAPFSTNDVGPPQATNDVGPPQVTNDVGPPQAINDVGPPQVTNDVGPPQVQPVASPQQITSAKSIYPDVSKLPLQNSNSFSQGRSSESKSADAAAQILRSENVLNLDGSYQYLYETDNGLNVKEQGQPKEIEGSNNLAMQVEGGFQYTAPDGTAIIMNYVANENGFQPTGDHIPTPPPVPALIQKALNYLIAHPPQNQP